MLKKLLLIPLALSACSTSRFDQYRERIRLDHDSQLFPLETPITSRIDTTDYRDRFALAVCKDLDKGECEMLLKDAVYSRLRDKYYAAALDRVSSVCAHDPVDCNFNQWELMTIRSHNEGIEYHRAEALMGLEMLEAGIKPTRQQNDAASQAIQHEDLLGLKVLNK